MLKPDLQNVSANKLRPEDFMHQCGPAVQYSWTSLKARVCLPRNPRQAEQWSSRASCTATSQGRPSAGSAELLFIRKDVVSPCVCSQMSQQ
jgi:hypothetical protein